MASFAAHHIIYLSIQVGPQSDIPTLDDVLFSKQACFVDL